MLEIVRKILDLSTPRERLQLLALFFAVIIMAALEVVGVASIMPFMTVATDPQGALQNPQLAWIYNTIGFASAERFLLFLGFLVLGLLLLSNAFSAFTTWMMLRFVWLKHHRLSQRVFAKYLSQPYTFFLNQNTAKLNKNILAEVGTVTNGLLIPALQVGSRAIVSLAIVGLLLAVDPGLALTVVVVLGGSFGGIYLLVRNQQARIGRKRLEANSLRFKTSGEAFGGIKDVKLLGKEREFVQQFSGSSRKFARYMALNAMVAQLPRYGLEAVAFGGILVIMLYLIGVHGSTEAAIPAVSLYALAGYRLMPALQKVFNGAALVRFNTAALEDIHADLTATDQNAGMSGDKGSVTTELQFNREVRLERVSVRYPGAHEDAIREVSLVIPHNHVVAFVGRTGSGKTTLVDLILGLLEPRQGRLLVDEVEIRGQALIRAWQRRIGYVPQQIFLTDDSIRRNIAFGVPQDRIDDEGVRKAADAAHLTEFIGTLRHGYDTIVGERGVRLSGGQRQRIGIARALYHRPDVLVLDEATSALDSATEDYVMDAIRELSASKTIILIAHRISTVVDADEIFVLEAGSLVARGTHGDLLAASEEFRRVTQPTESRRSASPS